MRRDLVWPLVLPLLACSWLSAHYAAFRLVPPAGGEHGHVHSSSEHAGFLVTPLLLALGVALALAGLALCIGGGVRGRRHSGPSFRLFALVPAAGFAVQEHLEHLLDSGAVPLDLVAHPTFLAGLALQLPFAIAALLVARALYALGYGIGRTLASVCTLGRSIRPGWCTLIRQLPRAPILAVPSALALGHGQRAPPPISFP